MYLGHHLAPPARGRSATRRRGRSPGSAAMRGGSRQGGRGAGRTRRSGARWRVAPASQLGRVALDDERDAHRQHGGPSAFDGPVVAAASASSPRRGDHRRVAEADHRLRRSVRARSARRGDERAESGDRGHGRGRILASRPRRLARPGRARRHWCSRRIERGCRRSRAPLMARWRRHLPHGHGVGAERLGELAAGLASRSRPGSAASTAPPAAPAPPFAAFLPASTPGWW